MRNYFTKSRTKKVQAAELELRNNVNSISEYIQGVELILKSVVGVKITFTSYPFQFGDVSNSHNAPIGYEQNWHRERSKPTTYPGYKGLWGGTVEVIGKPNYEVCFDEVVDIFPPLNTGTGNFGSTFSGDGMLWVFDFPKIKEQFDENIDYKVDSMSKFMKKLINEYTTEYRNAREGVVSTDVDLLMLKETQVELYKLAEELTKAIVNKEQSIRHDFNKTYGIPIPKPENPFSGLKMMKELQCEMSAPEYVVHPKCDNIYTEMTNVRLEMQKLKGEFPEYFI